MTAIDATLWMYAAIGIIVIGGMVVNLVVQSRAQNRIERVQNRVESTRWWSRSNKPPSPDQTEVSFSEAAARLMIATERQFMRELCARQCEMAAREHERHGFQMGAMVARECEERIRAMRIDAAAMGE